MVLQAEFDALYCSSALFSASSSGGYPLAIPPTSDAIVEAAPAEVEP